MYVVYQRRLLIQLKEDTTMSIIRDESLYPSGDLKIEWVRRNCPLLRSLEDDFRREQPFKGRKIALSIHLEAKTAYLCKVLKAGGALMYVTGSNPLSTQDDVAAALVHAGLNVYAWHGATEEEYNSHIRETLSHDANIIIDDGGDLVHMLHTEMKDRCKYVIGGCEETTTGIIRLKSMVREGKLEFPMVMVNDADCKHLFDNRYGTGQSVWNGINRTTNLIVAGKTVVVAGYGWCGKGVSMRAKALGARVIVTEVDPIKAIEAVMDGYDVMPMKEAARYGDFFVTVTGCAGVIDEDDLMEMKEGAILANAGHFDVEIDMKKLREIAVEAKEMRQNIMGYTLPNGKHIYVLAEGRLVNLAAGDGHPAEIMDMSFAIQALSAKFLVDHEHDDLPKLIKVPHEVDMEVANRKLKFLGKQIDTLTPFQEEYLHSSTV
jgi:adenosylhomocysteinase